MPTAAFEIKTFPAPLAVLQLYAKLQRYVDREQRARPWWNRRRIHTTLSLRQIEERLALRRTRVFLRHVCLDLQPANLATTSVVRQ